MAWIRTVRMMLKGVMHAPSAKQVALAIALGVAVGLVPKGNLLAFALGAVMCALRLNLPVAIATAVVVSLTAHFADPVFDILGGVLLTAEPLKPLWVAISEWPFSAWLQFNNTVVLGAFLIAIAQIYPTYRLTKPTCEKLLPRIMGRLQNSRVMRWWSRFEWSTRITTATHG